VALLLNHTTLSPGQTLTVGVHVTNPGPERVVDAYLGAIWPDGVTLVFITPVALQVTSFAETATWPAYGRAVALAEGLDETFNLLFSYSFSGAEGLWDVSDDCGLDATRGV
jgi:uncharacterized repeat protein (TIGR01451 family)